MKVFLSCRSYRHLSVCPFHFTPGVQPEGIDPFCPVQYLRQPSFNSDCYNQMKDVFISFCLKHRMPVTNLSNLVNFFDNQQQLFLSLVIIV